MTRCAIDAPTAIRLLREGISVAPADQLVAPNLLRSQALSLLYRSVYSGELTEREGRDLLDAIATMRIRLLGDRVSRSVAWRVAKQLGWDDTANAEYVAVTQLQADALIAADAELAAAVAGLVDIAPFEALSRA